MDDDQHVRVEKFRRERQRQNTRILEAGHLGINRFFNVGGSIVVPHLRHAFDTLDVLLAERAQGDEPLPTQA